MRAMIIKEFRELRRDRRTLGMLIAMPLLLLVSSGTPPTSTSSSVKTAVVGPQAAQVGRAAARLLRRHRHRAARTAGPTPSSCCGTTRSTSRSSPGQSRSLALVDGSNLFAAQSIVSVLNRLGDKVTTEVLYNPELKTSWVMIPAIIGLILTFIGTIVTSIGLVRERETGHARAARRDADQPERGDPRQDRAVLPRRVDRHGRRHGARDAAVRRPVQRQPARVRARRRAVPVRRPRARRVHLDDLADHRPGDPDRVLLPAAADPAVRA